jgi:predicted transcriptional regulator
MGEDDLPPDVRTLVSRRLHSMEEVDVVLLLARAAQALTVHEIRERLRLPASSLPLASLDRLIANDLIVAESGDGETRYRYMPADADLRRAVELLAVAYNERPVTLVRLVYQRRSPAQSFADAFRIRKDEP